MRQKLQHTEQACFALSQSKAVSFAVALSVHFQYEIKI
jgi:hypothetical protein